MRTFIPTSDNSDWNNTICNWSATGYRLPTEMEWMWAAMGADQDSRSGVMSGGVNVTGYSKAYSGDGLGGSAGDYAWYLDNSGDNLHPVGTKTANELGLYDMSGNVWEWCWDWYGSYPSSALTDYRGAEPGSARVNRGGSWLYYADYLPVAYRGNSLPRRRNCGCGFRVVRP